MGRHRTPEEKAAFKVQATEMRLAGIGAKRIAKELGIGPELLAELLRDVPPPAQLMRMRAKDEHREAAVLLRSEGRTYQEIQKELGVSKSSLSLWLRDPPIPTEQRRRELGLRRTPEPDDVLPSDDCGIARLLRGDGWLLREIAELFGVTVVTAGRWCEGLPLPPRATHGRDVEKMRAAGRAYWDTQRPVLEEARRVVRDAAKAEVEPLGTKQLDLLAAVAYWCEGSKSKPWQRRESLILVNSDPDIIRLFLAWLRSRGVGHERLALRLSIHESADVDRATRFWADVVGCDAGDFMRPTLKRHNPKTVRKNTGTDYVGCLVVSVRRSRDLYLTIEGLWRGVAADIVARSWGAAD